MRKRNLIHGVGINDVDTPAKGNPYYAVWLAMLQRAYNPKMQERNPCYVGVSVAPEWHRFSAFNAWMVQQAWHHKVLDKDLRVPGNKVYSPDTCLFVTPLVNTLLNKQPRQRGLLPLGVNGYGERFKVTFKKDRRTVHAGVFDTVEAAATAYGHAKADWIEEHAKVEQCPITKQILLREADKYRQGVSCGI